MKSKVDCFGFWMTCLQITYNKVLCKEIIWNSLICEFYQLQRIAWNTFLLSSAHTDRDTSIDYETSRKGNFISQRYRASSWCVKSRSVKWLKAICLSMGRNRCLINWGIINCYYIDTGWLNNHSSSHWSQLSRWEDKPVNCRRVFRFSSCRLCAVIRVKLRRRTQRNTIALDNKRMTSCFNTINRVFFEYHSLEKKKFSCKDSCYSIDENLSKNQFLRINRSTIKWRQKFFLSKLHIRIIA